MAYQPTVALDFDGVIHGYTGWTGPEPIDGVLKEATLHNIQKSILSFVTAACVFGLLSMAVLAAQEPPASTSTDISVEKEPDPGPTPLGPGEVAQAAEIAILVQSAQIQAMQAQARLEELNTRYRQIIGELRAKHNAAGCNLTAKQEWACPAREKGGDPPAAGQGLR